MNSIDSAGSRVAVVSGADDAVGAATVRRFTARGLSVVAIGPAAGRFNNDRVLSLDIDPIAPGAADKAVALTVTRFGRLDILANTGCTRLRTRLSGASEAALDDAMTRDLRVAARLCRAAVPAFRQAGGGRIINLAAMEALFPKDGCGAQAIAGGAVIALSRSLAVELGPQGIAVNTIVPGPLSQDWPAGRDDAARGRLVGRVALRRLAEADDIAAAIMILADPALNFTTGFTLVADGGYSLQTGPGMPY